MTYIIAEIGSNWHSMDGAVRSIERAKACGADAVKFQTFNEIDLYGAGCTTPRRLAPNLHTLKEAADKVGIDFMCTAFSPEGLRYVDKFVDRHKIASAEMMHIDMLDEAIATKKPLYISTGGHTLEEAQTVAGYVDESGAAGRTTLLYCEGAYPANRTCPERLGLLHRGTGLPVGLSDHSTEVYLTAWLAQAYAIPVIEKHVNLVGADGPDAPHSLDREGFRDFCAYLKDPRWEPLDILSPAEADFVTQHNRRLIATCDIPKGATICKGVNFGAYRGQYEQAHGINPFEAWRVNGKVAARDISSNEVICDGDFA